MRNQSFEIQFDPQKGTIISIVNPQDPESMNWCDPEASMEWGMVLDKNKGEVFRDLSMKLESFEETMDFSRTVCSNGIIQVTTERYFQKSGNFVEEYHVKNLRNSDLFLERGELGICVPFNDRYTDAEDCRLHRCNTHIWCGQHSSWVNAMRMGVSDYNLGMVLIKGELDSYSVMGSGSNTRGTFILNHGYRQLREGEEFTFAWELFWHKGDEDFRKNVFISKQYIDIRAEHFTLFQGEKIQFTAQIPDQTRKVSVFCENAQVAYVREKNLVHVSYSPQKPGEYRFWILADEIRTHADFLAVSGWEQLVDKRVRFIVEKQQYHCPESPLDGAFLIYDNKEGYPVFDSVVTDHNACRERVGMALLLIKYLQRKEDDTLRSALERYLRFLYREFLDSDSGEVFDGAGKDRSAIRLYNAPWITLLLTEMYVLTKEREYLDQVLRILEKYYTQGGKRFYPNGLSMVKTVEAFRHAGMHKEAQRVLSLFEDHVNNMIAHGLYYPKHEVNFEQTIVTAPANYISEMGILTGNPLYQSEAKKHIEVLERFSGHQPDFHQNEIPIRFWDDFWFGKAQLYGDTFPHYWSCLTARAYMNYYRLTGEKKYQKAARECFRNCLCLFTEEGKGSCAYVYPFKVNGQKGEFYDEWANDQDFALYFYMDYQL